MRAMIGWVVSHFLTDGTVIALLEPSFTAGFLMSEKQVPIDPSANADLQKVDGVHEIADDLGYQRHAIVNIIYYGVPAESKWVLIDTGLIGSGGSIESTAAKRFGENVKPQAIVLTHGHSDHAGSLKSLAQKWDVPVYAHLMEHPYLNGSKAYPPPDPGISGGMAKMSLLLPRGPVDVTQWLRPLPEDESVPGMPGWKWIHTPGHTPGHVSLWRESDRAIIAGDAFITTNQESAYAVATQREEIHGPPQTFTPDWESARTSVQKLAALQPDLAVTGHGRAMRGPQMSSALDILARDFDSIAVPEKGIYVHSRDEMTREQSGRT